MSRIIKAVGMTFILLISLFTALVFVAPNVAAATRMWTTDTDFDEPGRIFTSTEIVGTGVNASVELLKDIEDWKNMNPAMPPVEREGPGAAFSSYNNTTVLFGGYNWTFMSELDDTWEYDYPTNTWMQFSPNPHPDGREFALMSYDPEQNVVVLFGGINSTSPGVYLQDTWEYDVVSRSWSETTLTGPLMISSSMTYDSDAKVHIMVGRNYTSGTFQTWEYDASADSWTFLSMGGPASRLGHVIAYSEQLMRTVLFGGFDDSVPPGTMLGDTWEYNYATNLWSPIAVSGPDARQSHSMTYRASTTSVILFGGFSDSGATQDTWQYTSARAWESITVLTFPPARQLSALEYDSNSDVIILFGGRDGSGNQLGDTWSLEPSYRAAGKYSSSTLDSTCGNVNWTNLSWNKASQPLNTFLRFQLATSNSPSGPWNYVGPSGSVSNYYLTTPETIWTGHDNERYLRFLGDFGTFDTHATPSLEDLTVEYDCPPSPPYIVSTDPYHTERDVPLLYPITVTFSEEMDPATVTWQFLIGPSVPLTPLWSSGNTILELTHTQPFIENTAYQIEILGKDVDGNDLVANPIDPGVVNPWLFFTLATYPYITTTNPALGDADVPLTADIIVDFSEPMNSSSVQWTIDPNITLTQGWSNGDARLTLSHTELFKQCIPYTVEITQGEDKFGLQLIPGPMPNPWSFTTACINPFITEVSPYPLEMDVPLSTPIYVNFSKTMDTSTVTVTPTPPIALTPTWTDSDKRLMLTHANFPGCTPYEIKVEGKDLAGNDLIPGPFPSSPPNPWSFMTLCANPFIIGTAPDNGTTNVSIDKIILIAFSEQMITSSVEWTIDPAVAEFPPVWNFDTVLNIDHVPFEECTRYTVHVTKGRNTAGFDLVPGPVPNPFVFNTICESPYIVSTDPADGQGLVQITQDIIVNFSEAMNTTSVLFVLTPNVTGMTQQWSNGDMTLTVTHTADFQECTQYEAFVDGTGADGRNLLIPGPGVSNPWNFTTWCPGFYIVSTDPADQTIDVPLDKDIIVTFSQPADPSSFSVTPNPPVNPPFSPIWSNGDRTVTLTHTTPFMECTDYTITVSADDLTGNPLTTVPGSAPNPWTFKTVCLPQLSPPGGLDVTRMPPNTVRLTWSAVAGATSYVIYSDTSKDAPWPWPQLDEITVTTYDAPHLSDGLSHFYIVRAKTAVQVSENSTMGAKVHLTFPSSPLEGNIHWFSLPYRSTYSKASDISSELTSTLVNVIGKWDPATQRPILWYFFRGMWRGTDFTINPGDGLYLGARTGFTWVIVGTDGSVELSFNLDPPTPGNVNWISLPYTSAYVKASDIVLDIEGSIGPGANTKITEIAKWDTVTQTLVKYSWTPSGWSGTDFMINPGDGIHLKIVTNFTWTPMLLTPEVP
jgi:hypothetical protein